MSTQVSIIMSCYNEEKTVGRAIASMLNQSFSKFEFIIIDDASSDNTLKIIKEYAARDTRIFLIQNEINLGLSKSLNMAIATSSAKYIARMDADDESHLSRLQKQYDFFKSNPNIDILGTGVIPYSAKKNMAKAAIYLPELQSDIVCRVFRKTLVFHPTIMIRRSVYNEYGLYDPELRWAEDADLWFRIYDKVVFHNLPEALLTYTIKTKLNWRIIKNNLQVKIRNLKKRHMLFTYAPFIVKDTLYQISQIFVQR